MPCLAQSVASSAVLQVVYGLISRRRQQLAATPAPEGPPADLLQALLCSVDEEGAGMTDTALRDELLTLLIGAAVPDHERCRTLSGPASALRSQLGRRPQLLRWPGWLPCSLSTQTCR